METSTAEQSFGTDAEGAQELIFQMRGLEAWNQLTPGGQRRARLAYRLMKRASISQVKFREGLNFNSPDWPQDLVTCQITSRVSNARKFAISLPITKESYKEEFVRNLCVEELKQRIKELSFRLLANNEYLTKPKGRLP